MSVTRIPSAQKISDLFERRKVWRRSVAASYLAIYLVYLGWRFTIISGDSIFLSLLYLFAEILGFILVFNIVARSWRYQYRKPKPVIHGLNVDVFVTTYKEPTHMIRRTVMAAKEIEYPHQTWILDDGKRPEIKKIAEELGVNYISREKNTHAKAGNLNFGLQHSKADFVMVFDADHMALPHALNMMLGFFIDEKVAMAQAPQEYYNDSAFQYMNCKKTGTLWHDQSFFYYIAQPCYDSINATSCLGTGVIYRRKALDEIGGIPVASLTEDTHTAIKIEKIGYKSVYLNETVAYGVASADLGEYYTTRKRWGHGNIQVAKEEKFFSCKGLNFYSRLLHICTAMIYCEGWQQLIFLLIPIVTLVFGLPPFEISVFNVIVILLFPLLSYIMLKEANCGFIGFWSNEVFAIIKWPIHIMVTAACFGKKLQWFSSTKDLKGSVDWKLMIPQFFILIASIGALLTAFYKLHNKFEFGPLFLFFSGEPIDIHSVMRSGYTADLVLISGLYVFYNIFRILFFIRKAIRDSKNSHDFFRFAAPFPITLDKEQKHYGHVLEISEDWIRYCDFNSKNISKELDDIRKISIHLPTKVLDLTIKVEKKSSQNVEGKIIWSSNQDRDDLARALYFVEWRREFLNRNFTPLAPSDFLKNIVKAKPFSQKKYETWNSFLYQEKPAVMGIFTKDKNSGSIIVFEELKVGSELVGSVISDIAVKKVRLKIIAEEALSSLLEKGFDGSTIRRYTVSL
jgi:cellulose synthase (UDP-forming)